MSGRLPPTSPGHQPDVVALVAAIVVILVLGMGGLLALRINAMVELGREVRRRAETDDPQAARRRRRRALLTLGGVGAFYVVAGALFLIGRAVSGPRLAAALVAVWLVCAVVGAFVTAIWWDIRHRTF